MIAIPPPHHFCIDLASRSDSILQVVGTGNTQDTLHTAFDAIAEQHFIPAIVDFYNSPTVRVARYGFVSHHFTPSFTRHTSPPSLLLA